MQYFSAILFVLIVAISSCNGDQVIYEEYHEIDNAEWSYDQPHQFNFEVSDTSKLFRLLLYIEYSTEYKWQNFYTEISTTFPNDSIKTDVVSLDLASKSGQWFGKCNSHTCSLTIPLQERVKFKDSGSYSISFDQFMREEKIDGIKAIGLKLIVPADGQ